MPLVTAESIRVKGVFASAGYATYVSRYEQRNWSSAIVDLESGPSGVAGTSPRGLEGVRPTTSQRLPSINAKSLATTKK